MRKACLLLLLFCLPAIMAQNYGAGGAHVGLMAAPPAAAAGGTDFSADSRFVSCWKFEDCTNDCVNSTTDTVADICSNGGTSDTLTIQGATPGLEASNLPPNAPSGMKALIGKGENYFTAVDSNDWGVAGNSMTMGCWYEHDGDSEILSHRIGGASGWTLNVSSSVFAAREAQFAESEPAATSLSGSTWYHLVAQFEYVDGANDIIRVFVDGVEDCTGACISDASFSFDSAQTPNIGADDGGNILGAGAGAPAHLAECWVAIGTVTSFEICESCRFGFYGDTTDRGEACSSSCDYTP